MAAARAALGRAAGTLTILRRWPGQRRVHYLPREELTKRRDARVRATISYAVEHVPFYRDLARQEGFDPREIATAGDLRRLALIGKEDVRGQPVAFRSTSPRAQDGVVLRSTGTTGSPLDLFHDRRTVLENIAYAERERVVETELCGKRYGYTGVFLDTSVQGGNLHRVRDLGRRSSFRPLAPKLIAVPTEGRVEEVAAAINRIRPDVLRGTGAYVETLFRTLGAPSDMHRPKAISYSWDGMTAAGRRFVEEEFGIPVISHYSAMECLKIGFFCERRDGFHLHEDLCHLELVDVDGEPVPVGEPGEVVISNLVNRGTVLLRYRLGDIARLEPAACPCGRTSHRLVDLEGRLSEVIRLQDGSVVHSRGVGSVANKVPGLIRFQLVQREATSFDLHLATVDREAFDKGADAAATQLRALLTGCDVRPVYRDEIPLEPGVKYRPVVLLND